MFEEVNKDNYSDLPSEAKHLVEMYITARQFKNAVLEDEIIILPAGKSGFLAGSTLQCGSNKITFRGDKTLVRVYPYIVNKSFSCEVFLKLLLVYQGRNLKELKTHKIAELYAATDNIFKKALLTTFQKHFGDKADEKFLDSEIRRISDVFNEWRYIYEQTNEEHCVNYGFLSVFCDYLDAFARQIILEKYGYDVSKNIR